VLPVIVALAVPSVAQAADAYINPALSGCSDATSIVVAGNPRRRGARRRRP
jgi:hypothetical protein